MTINDSRKILTVLILIVNLFLSLTGEAQTTIRGKVTDIQTFEPIVFADVFFKGTSAGTNTRFDGSYMLTGPATSDSIVISFIGYETKKIAVVPGIDQVINVQLHPALYSIPEIIIRPGENPAITLLKKVWKNIPLIHIENLSAYQYENYSRSVVFIRKAGYYKKSDNRYLKPFSKEFEKYSVKTGPEDIPAIPSYFTETISNNFYLKSTGQESVHIKASTSDGIAFNNTSLPAQLISRQENFNFMDNTIRIIDKSFISPLSESGPLYYRYYLTDSMLIDDRFFCYEVNFSPRNEEGPVFHGTFWINDTTYALKRISVELGHRAELNFIRRLRIQQDYEPVESSAWFPVRTRFMADAANLFITNFSQKTQISINKPHETEFYSSELKTDLRAEDFKDNFWQRARTNSLEKIDTLVFEKIDSLKKSGRISISAKLIEAAIRGYYNFGKFEAGPYLLLYDHNNTEGNRFRLGGRTNAGFSRKIIIEGYGAFGTKDKRFKGSIQSEYFVSKEKWTKIGLQVRNDIENTGALDEFYSQNSFLTFASTFGGSDKLAWSGVIRTWLESDLLRGLNGRVIFTGRTFSPETPDFYFAWYADPLKTRLKSAYRTSEAGLIVTYQPKAVYVLDGLRRFPVNFNMSPVFTFEYFRGFKGFAGGDFTYDKVVAGISHKFNPGALGSVACNLRFTKIFGAVPYTLLTTFAGNQSFFRADRTYNLMNSGEFVADESLEMFFTYHMNGLILAKIPLLKKLDLRTVFSANEAFGKFNEGKNGFFDPGTNPEGILPVNDQEGNPLTGFNILSYEHPYAEFSYGIENVFRFFRIDLVQRLTYLDNPDVHRFAVKVSGVFRF